MTQWYLVQRMLCDKPVVEWLKDECDRWRNHNNGWFPKGSSHVVLETAKAEEWYDLDQSKTTVYIEMVQRSEDPDVRCGWVSPSGKLHRCRYQEHDDYTFLVLRSDEETLRKTGWIKVSVHPTSYELCWYPLYSAIGRDDGSARITQAQARALRKIGLVVEEDEVMTNG